MASLRDIRRKIGTVKNIRKITTAMKMVAAAKLRRAQDRVAAARPYADKMKELITRVAPLVPPEVVVRHRLLQSREAATIGVVVITSDRGMCGSYNNNIIRKALEFLNAKRAEGVQVELITIGRRATNSLRSRGWPADQSFGMLDVNPPPADVQAVLRAIVGLYTRDIEPVSEVYVAYAEFINAVTQVPRVDRFLPIEAGAMPGEAAGGTQLDFEFEPDPERLLDVLLPRFVDNRVYQYLLEATASEYGARMTAMSTASDNAGEMIDTLTLHYNRARQDAITKELMDIVGGATALASD
ncbi:MAG: ATP synthase F1 subunit gamma [Armatimonadetes bacterium]|nr:ATP synthase F1 subunit gamma [Armatimonadota bacterium]